MTLVVEPGAPSLMETFSLIDVPTAEGDGGKYGVFPSDLIRQTLLPLSSACPVT